MAATTTGVRDIYVEANGLRHHLLARGEPGNPVVLMIHGLAGQAHNFDQIAEALSDQFHVYALDVRGRGESEWGPPGGYTFETYVEDVEAVRVALGLQRFALVGTWMGGLVSMLYAVSQPEHVIGLVMNDIGPEVRQEGRDRLNSYLTDSPKAFPDLRAVEQYFREHYGALLSALSDSALAEFARWHVRRNDLGVYTWKYDPAIRDVTNPVDSDDLWAAFGNVQCATLIIRGRESDLLASEVAAKMCEVKTDCTIAEVPASGHAPAIIEPEAAAAVRTFLKSVAGPA